MGHAGNSGAIVPVGYFESSVYGLNNFTGLGFADSVRCSGMEGGLRCSLASLGPVSQLSGGPHQGFVKD